MSAGEAGRRRRGGGRRAAVLAAAVLLFGPAAAQDIAPAGGPLPRPAGLAAPGDTPAARDLFALPGIVAALRAVPERVAAGDLAGAAALVDRLAARHPTVALLAANRAALHLLAGETAAAAERLEAAAALGFAELGPLLADPLFAPLAAEPRLTALAARPPPPAAVAIPAPLAGGTAPVEAANTAWNAARGRLEARFDADALPREAAVLGRQRGDNAYERLRDLVARGRAAGNHGDLYDNRDRGHSRLPAANHPQVSAVAYGVAAVTAEVDYGLAGTILFDRPTFGNSSTAFTAGPLWRSQGRHALTHPDGAGPLRLFDGYAANHVYVYPSHRDHDPERGDLFPANTPYMLVSQGSSGSDQPFLEALAMIFAAFRPETKARLIEEGLVAPTVQYVFRRSQRSVLSRADYFSGLAHPSVFPAYEIGLARMVSLANAIEPDAIPPMARIAVIEEETPREGVDFFGAGLSERLFDTPAAVARVWRSRAWSRSYLLSAEATEDPNDRPLAFHWHLLRGDPGGVRIEPLDGGTRARVTIEWQEPRPVAEESDVTSPRIDIGVFADNGAHDGAPAIFSLLLPAHETRAYEEGPDGAMRIAAIDHADPAKAEAYLDPMLMARADWRDTYRYDADGRPLGWTRHRDGRAEDYDAAGARILARDAAGRPDRTEPVAYRLGRGAGGELVVEEVAAGS